MKKSLKIIQQRLSSSSMQYKQVLGVLLVFFLFQGSSNAQNRNIDSLLTLLKKDKADTNKVNHLNQLCRESIGIGLNDTALYYGNEALILAQKLLEEGTDNKGIKKGMANSYNHIGAIYYYQSDYPKTLEYWLKALELDERLKNKTGMAKRLSNLGLVYWSIGDYSKTLDYYFKSLKLAGELLKEANQSGDIEAIGRNKMLIANNLGNTGMVYYNQGFYQEALDYYFKALKLAEELKDSRAIARNLGNIGIVYYNQAEAIPSEKSGAIPFQKETLYNKALEYDFRALKIDEEIGNKTGISADLGNIGALYCSFKKYKEAYHFLYRAIALSDSIGAKDNMQSWYNSLSKLYENSNVSLPDSVSGKLLNMEQMRLRAIYYYKRSIAIKDTIFSQENKKQLVRKEMNYEFDKKEAITNAENEKQQAVAEEKNRKQKIITCSVAFGLLLVLLFAGFIFRSLRITRKQKQIIEIKSTETEQQKKIIEEKNKDITDSIHYAKRIQHALLRDEEHTSMHLPEHFILFLPKDIVSGDFYWGAEKNEYWYFAAVDCTGHGVPGAVMSMLGVSFLNDIVSIEGLPSPAEILNRLRDKIIKELRQTGEVDGNKDGMDISLARLNLKTNELEWAGANNSLNLIQNGQLGIVKADKQPIGYHPKSHPFTNHKIQLKKGDSIYLYSDGYADQFGGPKGKKFKYKQLDDLILTHKLLPMGAQKQLLKKHFTEWKGALEQVDDVCVFGVKI
ncbi:MAG: tetratricopeptide repeat protein [Bacteroidota bacterium]